MKTYAVEVAAVAERHLRAILEWWKVNRPASPELFERELVGALQQLADAPRTGSPYAAPRPAGTRRLLLRKSGYHVYYTLDDDRAVVTVRALWHAARGRPPRLR